MNESNSHCVWESAASEMLQKGELTREAISNTPECVKTGFTALDDLLGGGLMPGLIVLGGSPGLGKSTLALYIAEHVASEGTPVLYYSYEMSHLRIKSKLIACRNFENHRSEKDRLFQAKELFNSEMTGKWGQEKWESFEEAYQAVLKHAENLFIIDCNKREKRYSAEEIAENVKRFINAKGKQPLVIVDYLQILPSDNLKSARSERQTVDDNLDEMSALAEEMNIPIVLISSLSRGNYKKPMQIDAFKDSGGIEYSADVLLGIQFSACHNENGDPVNENEWSLEAEKKRYPRNVEVVILKQRYGSTGEAVPLYYYPQYDAFAPRMGESHQQNVLPEEQIFVKQQEAFEQNSIQIQEDEGGQVKVPGTERTPEASESDKRDGEPEREGAAEREVEYINNTLIANRLRKGEVVPNEWHEDLVLPQMGVFKSAFVKYRITYSGSCENCGMDKPQACKKCDQVKRITGYDCNVADAIFSIFCSGQSRFTLRRLLTVLTGDNKQTLTKPKKEELRRSVEKLRSVQIEIDCTDEMNRRYLNRGIKEASFSGPLLSVTEENGAYSFNSENRSDLKNTMPLYAYAQTATQIITFPADRLQVAADMKSADGTQNQRKLSDTAETITIKRFLLYRLEVIYNKKTDEKAKKNFRTISFEDGTELMKVLDLRKRNYKSTATWNHKRRQVRETVETVLAYFERIGYIDGYESTDKGSLPSFLIREIQENGTDGTHKK